MAISTTDVKITYTADGVQKDFTFPYVYYDQSQLLVYANGTLQSLGGAYTVNPATAQPGDGNSGGTVTFISAPANGVSVLIVRSLLLAQALVLGDGGNFPAKTIEKNFDQLVMMLQQNDEKLRRAMLIPVAETLDMSLPAAATRANKYLGFDASGKPMIIAQAIGTSAVSAYAATLLDDADAATARGTLDVYSKAEVDTDIAAEETARIAADNSLDARVDTLELDANDNPIINPCMDVWQRGTVFAAAASGTYTADRWKWVQSGTGVVTIQSSTSVPTKAEAGVVFNNSLEIDVTTADAALAAGDFYFLSHSIEGYNWKHFSQRDIAVSFWVYASRTGEHALALSNAGFDRTWVGTYTVNASNTWEKKTVALTASPSAGTWNHGTGIGLELRFCLGAGSTYHTTPGAWQTGNFIGAATTVNDMDSAANFFRITGVKLELGSVATPLRMRHFKEELALCQRYYETGAYNIFSGDVTNLSNYYLNVFYKVTKRAVATVTTTILGQNNFAATNPGLLNNQVHAFVADKAANGTGVGFYSFSWTASAEL
jgi:hypothetical protein